MQQATKSRVGCLVAAGLAVTLAGGTASAQTNIKFSLDFSLQGSHSPFFLAEERGYYKAEGVTVTAIDTARGAGDAVVRVATGTYDVAFGDINSLIEFNARNPGKEIPAVLIVYDKAPMSIVTLKTSGISKPADLVGKKAAAPNFDAGFRMFNMFAKVNGFDPSKVNWSNVAPQLREPMLARGETDAISGFSFGGVLALRSLGVPDSRLNVMMFSNYGLDLYSNAIVVSPALMKSNPKAVAGFVKAVIRGWKDAVKDPKASIAALKNRDPLINEALELDRLNLIIRDFVLTDWVRQNGMGGVDPTRLKKNIDLVTDGLGLPRVVPPEQVFDEGFLPPASERKLM
jgi:NitT/TauT family transport system substrate-binding protein